MAFNFGFNNSNQVQNTNQSMTQSQYSTNSQTGSQSQESSRQIEGASAQEQDWVGQLMSTLFGNMQSAQGFAQGGYQDAITAATGEYNRLIENGARSSLGVMAKSGMNSSIINNMMGAMNEGAAGNLASNIMQMHANMPMQGIQAINATSGGIMNMLQSYFLGGRSQNVSQTGASNNAAYGTNRSNTSGTSTGTTTAQQSGFNFGF